MSYQKSWLKRCDINHCVNEFNNSITFFPVPRDPILFKKWSEAVKFTGTILPQNGRVCEKHFGPKDIIEFKCLKKQREGPAGSELTVIGNISLRVPIHGAVPSKFDDEVTAWSKKQAFINNLIRTDEKPSVGSLLIPPKPTGIVVQSNAKHMNSVAENTHQVIHKIVQTKQKTTEESFFEKLYNGIIEPRVPKKSWNIHYCSPPAEGIVFAELSEMSPDLSTPPFIKKSVYFDKKFNIRVYFCGKLFPNVEYNKPKGIKDLEELLKQIDSIMLCEGGPSLTELSNSRYAFKDEVIRKWRHNNCELRLQQGKVCKNCLLLRNAVGERNNDLTKLSIPNPVKRIKIDQNKVMIK